MNRRKFIGTTASVVVGAAASISTTTATKAHTTTQQVKGPFSIEIISPPEKAVRELPLFDSYKQAENFAQARMSILRSNSPYWSPSGIPHEAGLIKVWSASGQVVYECAWGETWTAAYSYVDVNGCSEAGAGFNGRLS
jgi:hypothetical protein